MQMRDAAFTQGGQAVAAFQQGNQAAAGVSIGQSGKPATEPFEVVGFQPQVRQGVQAVRKGTREQQLHELGDVLAWLASLAGQLGLSLDEAAGRYVTDPP